MALTEKYNFNVQDSKTDDLFFSKKKKKYLINFIIKDSGKQKN